MRFLERREEPAPARRTPNAVMSRWARRALASSGTGVTAVLAILAVLAAIVAVWNVLPNRAVDDSRFSDPSLSAKDGNKLEEGRLKALSDTRVAGAQLFAVLAVLAGGIATWRTVRLTREGQITDRYATAIEHLGTSNTQPTQQLGGVYALERIARDSRRDHWPIMEILVGHLRAVTPLRTQSATQPRVDVTAIAVVLTRRRSWRETREQTLDLWRLDLRNIRLNRADLRRANLSESDLSGAHLNGACLDGAHLEGTRFRNARLRGATLRKANVGRASFNGADLEKADFRGAEFLPIASFVGAKIRGAKGLPPWAQKQAAHRPLPKRPV